MLWNERVRSDKEDILEYLNNKAIDFYRNLGRPPQELVVTVHEYLELVNSEFLRRAYIGNLPKEVNLHFQCSPIKIRAMYNGVLLSHDDAFRILIGYQLAPNSTDRFTI